VPGPYAIGLRHVERSLQGVFSHRQAMRGFRRSSPFAGALRSNLRRPHQPSNAILANAVTCRAQLLRDPRTAVAAARTLVRLANPIEQLAIGLRSSALWPTQPRIVSGSRNLDHRAHQLHCKAAGVVLDGSVLHLCSFAKNAAARFKKSRSCVTRASSRRSRTTSSCSAFTAPRVLPAAPASRSSRIQRCSTLAFTPSSRATCVTGLPESFASRTACDLYSSLYWRRDLRSDISNLRFRNCPPYEGVHETGGGSKCSHEELCFSISVPALVMVTRPRPTARDDDNQRQYQNDR